VRMERYESPAGGAGARGLRAHVKARLLGVQYLLLSPR
jgi:hypothetical protein